MTTRVAGIFVGGAGSRMGGVAKGLLEGPDRRPLIERWTARFAELLLPAVLVGDVEAYRGFSLPMIADEPKGVGPLGGLIALLRHAGEGQVIVVACDMPWVSRALLERLLREQPDAPALAAKNAGQWQPFFARYDAAVMLPIAERRLAEGRRALHETLTAAGASALALNDDEQAQLRDWDTAADVVRDGGPWS